MCCRLSGRLPGRQTASCATNGRWPTRPVAMGSDSHVTHQPHIETPGCSGRGARLCRPRRGCAAQLGSTGVSLRRLVTSVFKVLLVLRV